MVRSQVTLTQSPMVTLRGQTPSHIIVGQPQVVKQLQTGVCSGIACHTKNTQSAHQNISHKAPTVMGAPVWL